MSRYGSSFREPPWVMGSPKEVMDWVGASHPSKKEKEKHPPPKKQFLKNLHIKFDFDVKRTMVQPRGLISRVMGRKWVEEDFDLLSVTELILRGLARAKFRNIVRIIVDGRILYDHPERKSDLRKTIDDFDEFSGKISNGKNVELTAVLADVERCTVRIKINKIHNVKKHSVEIQMKGRIREDIYHTFLNYLNEKIGLKDKEEAGE